MVVIMVQLEYDSSEEEGMEREDMTKREESTLGLTYKFLHQVCTESYLS